MSSARHQISLLKTHVRGDEKEFLSVAMEIAAREARHKVGSSAASGVLKGKGFGADCAARPDAGVPVSRKAFTGGLLGGTSFAPRLAQNKGQHLPPPKATRR